MCWECCLLTPVGTFLQFEIVFRNLQSKTPQKNSLNDAPPPPTPPLTPLFSKAERELKSNRGRDHKAKPDFDKITVLVTSLLPS